MVALLVALALAALIGTRPWQATPVGPRVGLAPGLGVGLDDAVRAGGGEGLAVSQARPVAADRPTLAADRPGGRSAAPPVRAGLASARVVAQGPAEPAQPVAVTEPPPAAEQPAPVPVAAPEPVTTPVALPEPQPAAPPPTRVASGLHPSAPHAAGVGDLGEEVEAEVPEDEIEGEEECSPPLSVFYEGASHELVLCREAGADGAFQLLLDGEPLQDLEAVLP